MKLQICLLETASLFLSSPFTQEVTVGVLSNIIFNLIWSFIIVCLLVAASVMMAG